jgi:excisionase family DNA binding protein
MDGHVERLMDAKQVAELLGVKPRTVFSLVDGGWLPAHRVGPRLLRFSAENIAELYRRSEEAAR